MSRETLTHLNTQTLIGYTSIWRDVTTERSLEAQIGQPGEIPVHLYDRFASLFIRRDQLNLNLRVHDEQAQQLRAAIARTAENADAEFADAEF